MKFRSDSFANGHPIPSEFAFGKPADPVAWSDNRSPHLAWSEAPEDTRSFALSCIDPDAPSQPDEVNQKGREVPATLPRVEFVHWLITDIPAQCGEFATAACSEGIIAHGKHAPIGPPGSKQGINDYTGWFAGDDSMTGDYYGYDGPCPPWNDSIIHHYHFRLYALNVASLALGHRFGLADLRQAMSGHVLAEAEWIGTYTLNPRLIGT